MHPIRAWTFSILLMLGGLLFALIGSGALDTSSEASNNVFAYIMFVGAVVLIITGIVFKFLVKCPTCERTLWSRGLPTSHCGHCGNKIPEL